MRPPSPSLASNRAEGGILRAMSEATSDRRDFFVSFNQADRAWANWIAWVLEEAGYSVFFQKLRRLLLAGQGPAVLTQAITGLGGIGKTQTARAYAYRHLADYALVWWLRAETPATLAADYARSPARSASIPAPPTRRS